MRLLLRLLLGLLLRLLVGLPLSLFLSLLGGICLLLGLHRGGDVGLGLLQSRNRIVDVGFGRTGPVHHRIGFGDGVLQRGAGVFIGHTARGIIQCALRLRNSRAQVQFQCVGIGRRL